MSEKMKIRIGMGLCAAGLLAAEIYIGLTHHGDWIRNSLGDILVMPLLYCLVRFVFPLKPKYGWKLPIGLLLFSFLVEGLQGIGIADRLHITQPLLRTIIGTTLVPSDFLYYTIGFLPLLLYEQLVRIRKKHHTI